MTPIYDGWYPRVKITPPPTEQELDEEEAKIRKEIRESNDQYRNHDKELYARFEALNKRFQAYKAAKELHQGPQDQEIFGLNADGEDYELTKRINDPRGQ